MLTPIEFIDKFLVDPETGERFVLNDAEIRFLNHAFQLDESGWLKYPELIYSCPKKSGKTALAAMILLYVVLIHGGQHGEGIVASNDLEQASARVLAAVKRLIEASPLLRQVATVYKNEIQISEPKATITAVTSDAAGVAGSNANIVIFDELWGFSTERAERFWDECTPPPTRKIAC
jgi:phage terminase large subunit-like protein